MNKDEHRSGSEAIVLLTLRPSASGFLSGKQAFTDSYYRLESTTDVAKRKQPFNPFYVLLLIVGVAFTITACAYALMMVRAVRPVSAAADSVSSVDEESSLMSLLDERGMEIMGVEVLLLALATVGAIGLDQWRGNREAARQETSAEECSPRREAGVGVVEER